MKKALGILMGILGGIVLLVIIAGVVVYFIVDKKMVEDQMKKALNRHVTIEKINVGIFAPVSGIEVQSVRISNFKTAAQLAALEGKPVPAGDVFIDLKSFVFKVKFMPLLKKRFELKELMLYGPRVNIVRGADGSLNFDDLTRPKKLTAEEKAALEKEKKEAEEQRKKDLAEGKKDEPLTADTLPVSVTIGKIGLENGFVDILDKKLDQVFQVYDLTAKVYDIDIDPKDLAKHDALKVKLALAIKTMGAMKTGSVKSFDIALALDGSVKPFDLKTRLLEPEASLKAGSPRGMVTGLQVLEKIKSVEQLAKYSGKLDFLQDTQSWKDASFKAWYKAGLVKVEDGIVKTADLAAKIAGQANVRTKEIDYLLDLVLAEKHKKSMRDGIISNLKKIITGPVAKYVTPEQIADTAMQPLLNKEKQVFMQYKVTRTWSDPKTEMVAPKLPTMEGLVKEAAGDVGDILKEKAQEQLTKATDTAQKEAGKQLKSQTKSLRKKLPF